MTKDVWWAAKIFASVFSGPSCFQRWEPLIYREYFKAYYFMVNTYVRSGVGKVRPAGQIRPAEAFWSAREVFSVYLVVEFDVRMYILFIMCGPEVPKIFETAREPKELPNPVTCRWKIRFANRKIHSRQDWFKKVTTIENSKIKV